MKSLTKILEQIDNKKLKLLQLAITTKKYDYIRQNFTLDELLEVFWSSNETSTIGDIIDNNSEINDNDEMESNLDYIKDYFNGEENYAIFITNLELALIYSMLEKDKKKRKREVIGGSDVSKIELNNNFTIGFFDNEVFLYK